MEAIFEYDCTHFSVFLPLHFIILSFCDKLYVVLSNMYSYAAPIALFDLDSLIKFRKDLSKLSYNFKT